jgi:hypothetical protein
MTEALLCAGADPNLKSIDAATPFHRAMANRQWASAALLASGGTSANLSDASGMTAFCRVTSRQVAPGEGEQRLAVIKILTNEKPDVTRKCEALLDGFRTRDVA